MSDPRDSSRTAILQNIRAVVEFLGKYSPFDRMAEHDLVHLAESARLGFYAEGDEILTPSQGRVRQLYIVKQGRVRGERPGADDPDREASFVIGPGECFPMAALLGERATRTVHRAAADTFCLELPREAFAELFSRSEPFRDFCLRGVSSLLERVNRQIQSQAAEQLRAQNVLNAPLAEIIGRRPVSCGPRTSLRDAIRTMHAQKVGSIVVCDDEERPLGIFTLHDLLAVMARGEEDFQRPIAQCMTASPIGLPPDAYAFDAAVLMARHQFGHVCVVDHGRLVGVVSERDLFALQRVDLVHLTRLIGRAEDLPALGAVRPQIGRLIDAMLAHGAHSTQVTRIITLLNDHTVARVLELALAEHGDPGVAFSWIAFGSEGRREQTLATDQDNGMIFQAPPGMADEEARQRLLPLARRVNQDLARVGFPLCKGNVMAGNPELCLSPAEWRTRFGRIIDSNTPENLLRSSIYFDFRPLWGGCGVAAQEVFAAVVESAADNTIFQRMMAANALRSRPPLGLIRDFVVSRDADQRDTLDLKVQGLTAFVDAARVLALANNLAVAGTLDRLQELAEREVIAVADASAWQEAFCCRRCRPRSPGPSSAR